MDALSKFVYVALGFKSSGGLAYPCHWCGILTTLLDAEDFHVCDRDQRQYIELGHDGMQAKFPLAGKDERNLEFFKEQTERYIARAKRLTQDELHLLVQRACFYEKGYAQAILDGKMLDEFDEREVESLGSSAEQYIDEWG